MILKKIEKIVANHFGMTGSELEELSENTNLKDEGDSLDILEITMEIENEFDIVLEEEELENLETLGELAGYVETLLS